MAEIEIELPDGRVVVVDDEDQAQVDAVKAKIQQDFPDLAAPQETGTPRGGRDAALKARQDRARSRGAGPLKRGVENFGRGVERIVTGDVSGQEFADAAETSIRSMTAPLGGDFIAAGAENITRAATGQPINRNALNEQRGRRQELADRAPLQAGASEALGFGGVQKIVTGLFPFLKVAQGSTVATKTRAVNTAKVATDAATVTAVGELAKGKSVGDTAKASGISAVIAPPAAAAIRALTQGAQGTVSGVRSALTESADDGVSISNAALRSIAQRTGQPIDDIRNAAQEFIAVNGRPPRLAEIVDTATIDQYKSLANQRARAAQTLDDAEELAASERPVEMRETLGQGNAPLAPEALENARNRQLTAALRNGTDTTPPVADSAIDNTPFIELFDESPELLSNLPGPLRRRVTRAIGAGEDDAIEPFTVGLGEDIRLALSNRGGPGDAFQFTEGSRTVRELLNESSDAYRQAMDNYREQSQFIDGVRRGRGVFTAAQDEFEQVLPTLETAAERAGVARGVGGEVASRAGETAPSAITTARKIQEPGIQSRITAAQGPQAAQRAADVGRTQTQAASNLARLSPRTELPPSLAAAAGDLTEIAAAATGRAGSQLIARVVQSTGAALRGLGVPPNAANNMARLLTDPNRTMEVIERLAQIGIEEQAIQKIAQDAGTMLAASSATETSGALIDDTEVR